MEYPFDVNIGRVFMPSEPSPTTEGTCVTHEQVAQVVDAWGNEWSLSAHGQIVVNGQTDPDTIGIRRLFYLDGLMWHEDAQGRWHSLNPGDMGNQHWTERPEGPAASASKRIGP